MRVEISTGFSVGVHQVDRLPRKGDILHMAEFVYTVEAVEWDHDRVPALWILTFGGHDRRLTETPIDWPLDEEVPRRGDTIIMSDEYSGPRHRVTCIEWFMDLYDREPIRAKVHTKPLLRRDAGQRRVNQAANEYGERWIRSGLSPM